MPTTYAHYRFGKEVTEALPRGLQNTIEYHRDLYDIGLHGSDILFYYKALKSHPVNQQGHTVHENFADTFFEHAVSVIEKAEDPAAARVYIYGVICHFALDSECHPYIEKMIRESGISHCELEMEFDRMMMSDDFINPVRHLNTKHIHPTMRNAKIIAPFFEDVTPEEMQRSLKSMIFYHKLFLVPEPAKRKALFMAMKAIGKYDALHGIVMSLEPNPACREYCMLLKRLYAGAVPLAASLILQFQKRLFNGQQLPERFHRTFGAGTDWEKLRL